MEHNRDEMEGGCAALGGGVRRDTLFCEDGSIWLGFVSAFTNSIEISMSASVGPFYTSGGSADSCLTRIPVLIFCRGAGDTTGAVTPDHAQRKRREGQCILVESRHAELGH